MKKNPALLLTILAISSLAVKAADPTPTFNGLQVSLGVYDPSVTPAGLRDFGAATIGPGIDFSVPQQGSGAVSTVVDLEGNLITETFRQTSAFDIAPFNGYELKILTPGLL